MADKTLIERWNQYRIKYNAGNGFSFAELYSIAEDAIEALEPVLPDDVVKGINFLHWAGNNADFNSYGKERCDEIAEMLERLQKRIAELEDILYAEKRHDLEWSSEVSDDR